MRKLFIVCISLLLSSGSLYANGGSADVSVGYVYPDEMDNLGVNHETYNVYEGLGISVKNLQYQFDNGLYLHGDFSNITMNNRQMRLSVQKPGLFSLSGRHTKYRRIYDGDGGHFTRRETTNLYGYLQPHKQVKLFGSFNGIEKKGSVERVYRPVIDTVGHMTDYTQTAFSLGVEGFCEYGRVRGTYKHLLFTDYLDLANDREGDEYSTNVYTTIPGHQEISLAGGFSNREDTYYDRTQTFTTSMFWGAIKWYLPKKYHFSYKLHKTNAEHSEFATDTKHNDNLLSLGRIWKGVGGVTGGYEYRTIDDEVNKSISNGYFASGWYKINDNWRINGRYAFLGKEIDKGSRVIGDEDRTRHMLKLTYTNKAWGNWLAKAEQRTKSYDDIDTKVSYTTLSSKLALTENRHGSFVFSYSYYIGEYENRSNTTSYEFTDHVLSGSFLPRLSESISLSFLATYYRTKRDVDVEKFSGTITAGWDINPGHTLECIYRVYTFDNLHVAAETYTANIVEVNFIKELQL